MPENFSENSSTNTVDAHSVFSATIRFRTRIVNPWFICSQCSHILTKFFFFHLYLLYVVHFLSLYLCRRTFILTGVRMNGRQKSKKKRWRAKAIGEEEKVYEPNAVYWRRRSEWRRCIILLLFFFYFLSYLILLSLQCVHNRKYSHENLLHTHTHII